MSLQEHPVRGDSANCWPSGLGAIRQAVLLRATGPLPTPLPGQLQRAIDDVDRRVKRLQARGGRYAQVRASVWVDAVRAALEASRMRLAVATDGNPRLAYSLPQAG